MGERLTSTYSMWNLFRNCRKAAHYRYVLELEPVERERNLSFGSLIHACLEEWHQRRALDRALAIIERATSSRTHDEEARRTWHLATAMMRAYAARYADEEFEVVALEHPFEGPIVNPATGAASRSFTLAGKVDGIVRVGGEYFVLEHKTAAAVDASYLERLWTDLQISLYAHYVAETLAVPIAGVIYNVLVKARLEQRTGESELEFEGRRAESPRARRRVAESDDEFQARLAARYAEPGMFHRERLYLGREQLELLRGELWEFAQAFLDARRRGVWYRNTSYCFQYGRPCPYLPLCRSGDSPIAAANLYRRVPPHGELRARSDEPSTF